MDYYNKKVMKTYILNAGYYTDGVIYSRTLILPKEDDIVNWHIVSEEEYEQLMQDRKNKFGQN